MNKLIANWKNVKHPKRHILQSDDGKRSLCGRFIPAHYASYDINMDDIKVWIEQNGLIPFDYECKTCFRILANENAII
jgi:hypothetical protein